jgi:hypothetical protein
VSTFRGFDVYLLSRVARARGEHSYFSDDTLRWFNAYGGTHARIDDSRTALVESVEHPTHGRIYRVVLVTFTPDVERGGESVTIERVIDNLTRGLANGALSRYVRDARAELSK